MTTVETTSNATTVAGSLMVTMIRVMPSGDLYIGSISASPTACPLRGYSRAGTQNDHLTVVVILSTGTPMPAQWTCRRRCRYRAGIESMVSMVARGLSCAARGPPSDPQNNACDLASSSRIVRRRRCRQQYPHRTINRSIDSDVDSNKLSIADGNIGSSIHCSADSCSRQRRPH